MRIERIFSRFALVAAAACLALVSSRAEARIFVCTEQLAGGVQVERFEGCMEATSAGESLFVAFESGTGGGAGAGIPRFGPYTIVKRLDVTSPLWRLFAADGTHLPEISIHFTRITEGGEREFFKTRLDDTLISSVSMAFDSDGGGAMVPVEVITLVFSRIEWTVQLFNPDGSAAGESTKGWDVVGNEPI